MTTRSIVALVALVACASGARAQSLVVNAASSPYTISEATQLSDVTVGEGATLVVDAPLTVTGDMTVQSGGVVTHTAEDLDSTLDVAGTLTVALGGSINVDGKGYGTRRHWDAMAASVVTTPYRAGGSYGGSGGYPGALASYDDQQTPVLLGSGGGNGNYDRVGGKGGGRILIRAATLVVNGLLSANGTNASSQECDHGGGGGSGGSISLDVGTFSGAGNIRANGAAGLAGGGGGRIAVHYDTKSFSGLVSAAAGTSPCGYPGGLGSTHVESSAGALSLGVGHNVVDATHSYASVTLSGGSVLRITDAAAVTSPINVVVGSRVEISSSRALDALSLAPAIAGTVAIDAPLSWTANLTVSGVLELNQALSVDGSVTFPSGGLATHEQGNQLGRLEATGAVDFQLGSSFNVDGKGYRRGQHWDPVSASVLGTPYMVGASHGGRGAGSSPVVYDSAEAPTLLGSGGGVGNYDRVGGDGGGRIVIAASSLIVNGILAAEGKNASTQECDHGGGGGSGGSIYLEVGSLSGSGSVRARGGTANHGGGGGRIAAHFDTNTFAGTVTAVGGGSSCGRSGAPGSTHFEGPSDNVQVGAGTLEIDAGDSYSSITLSGGSTLRILGAASVTAPIDIVPGARVELSSTAGLTSLSLVPTVRGTLAINSPVTWTASPTINGVLELNEHLTVSGDLTVPSGGLVTHVARETDGKLTASGTVDFRLGSSFNVDGLGHGSAQHWDPVTASVVGTSHMMGGSHGGRGADGGSRPIYGDPEAPTLLGSGGGAGNYDRTGGAGGGRIVIEATTLVVNGVLTADGKNASTQECDHGGGGGAGGSVFLTADTFSGSGVIRARGGSASRGGGGGRVAVFYDTKTFAGSFSTTGGGTSCGRPGSAGTIHVEGPSDDLSVGTGVLEIGPEDTYSSVTLTSGSILRVLGAASVAAPIDVVEGSRVELRSPEALEALSLVPTVDGTLAVYAPVTWTADVTVAGVLELNEHLTVGGDVTFLPGALATHEGGVDDGVLEASGTVDFRLGSFFNVDAKGFGRNQHWDPVTASVVATGYKYGGSYGGRGADGGSRPTYGDALRPTLLGSGGGYGNYDRVGGYGGGIIRIIADTLVLEGVFTANGSNASSNECDHGGGGGAGGSIWLDVENLRGEGIARANGGTGNYGGGGGRVYVQHASSTFDGQLFTNAGSSPCSRPGAAGTLVVEDAGTTLAVRSGDVPLDEAQSYERLDVIGGTAVLEGAAALDEVVVASGGSLSLVVPEALDAVGSLEVAGQLDVQAPVTLAGDVLVSGTAVVDDTLTVASLTVAPGGLVTHSPGVTTMALDVAGTLTVSSSGRIDATGKGLPGAPAAGFGNAGATVHPDTSLIVAGSGARNGGSHAALGGQANTSATVGASYDDPAAPAFGGGGGGQGAAGEAGGDGGGVIRIDASALVVDGFIAAEGEDGAGASSGGGGGAGGSVVINVGDLSGSAVGSISVAGGSSSSGGGAGGLLLLRFANDVAFQGTVTSGGGEGATPGGEGDADTNVEASAPSIVSSPSLVTRVGQPYTYQASAVGTQPITWSLVTGPPGAAITPAGLFTWSATGASVATVRIAATNSIGSTEQVFTLTAQAAPSITSTPSLVGSVGLPYHYNAADAPTASGSAPLSWGVSLAPPGLTIDPSTGSITWTPSAQGSYAVCIDVTNAAGNDQQCWQVDVGAGGGSAPSITSEPTRYAVLGQPYRYDDDGTPSASGTAPLAWGAQVAPSGLTVDAATGTISWTPTLARVETVCITVANAAGSDSQCFSVEVFVDPGPPQFISTPTLVTAVGAAYAYDEDGRAEATGPGVITYGKNEGPDELTIDADSGAITYTPAAAGNVSVVLTATTPFGTAQQAFTLTVLPDGEGAAPLFLHEANLLAAVGHPYVYDKDRRVEAVGAEPISYSKVSGPPGFAVDETTGLVSFVPSAAGPASVSLLAENAFGSDTYSFVIEVSETALGVPSARFTVEPASGNAPLAVTFDASASSGNEGAPIVSYGWRFGQSEPPASGVVVEHTYTTPGSRVAHLVVSNAFGVESGVSQVVRVYDEGVVPPSARILISEVQGSDSLNVAFACECAAGDTPIASYSWDLGDGSVVDAPALSHTFGPGGFTVTLTVVDENGLTATDQVFIRVSSDGNQPPLLQAGGTPTGGPAPLTVQLSALAADSDGELTGLVWTFPDESSSEEPAPSYTFEEPGVYSVRVEAMDDGGLSSSATVEIEVTADGARAPEILSVPVKEAVVGEPYAYDVDKLPAVRGSRPLRFSLGKLVGGETQGAPDGMRVDGATGEITWTPAAGQAGEQRVVLVVENDVGAAAQEWVVAVSGGDGDGPPPPEPGCGCQAASPNGGDGGLPAALALLFVVVTLAFGRNVRARVATARVRADAARRRRA